MGETPLLCQNVAMRRLAVAAIGLSACALFPSVDDLGGSATDAQSDVVGSPDASQDAGSDVRPPPDDAAMGVDSEAGMDAGDASPADTGADAPTVAIQFVQINYQLCTNKTSCAAALPMPVSAGSAIFAVVSAWKNQSVTFKDTLNDTYTIVVGPADDPSYRNVIAATFGAPGGANTVTATATTNTDIYLWAAEYKGVVAFDTGTFAVGTGTSASSGAITTAQNKELLFGYAGYWVGGSVSPNFTARSASGSGIVEDRVLSAAGSYTLTGTQNSSANWAFLLGAFK